MSSRTIAAFDVDGTLTKRDTLVPFLASIAGWPALARAAARSAPSLVPIALGRGNRDTTKERMLVRLLAGRHYDDVARAGVPYGREVVPRLVRPEMGDRLRWHLNQGHEVILVSAGLDVYLEHTAQVLGAHGLLCTQLEVDAQGRCTGRMVGGNCRGPAKAQRLLAHLGRDDATIWAYGDSAGDDEMLDLAEHAVRVRHRPLRALELRME